MSELVCSYSYFEGDIDDKLEREMNVSGINILMDRVLKVNGWVLYMVQERGVDLGNQ